MKENKIECKTGILTHDGAEFFIENEVNRYIDNFSEFINQAPLYKTINYGFIGCDGIFYPFYNRMSARHLLLPRYEVIEQYPGSNLVKGAILENYREEEPEHYSYKEDDATKSIYIERINEYPHLFKYLKWFENREVYDMPKRVLDKNENNIIEIQEWDMETLRGWIDKDNGKAIFLNIYINECDYFPIDIIQKCPI